MPLYDRMIYSDDQLCELWEKWVRLSARQVPPFPVYVGITGEQYLNWRQRLRERSMPYPSYQHKD